MLKFHYTNKNSFLFKTLLSLTIFYLAKPYLDIPLTIARPENKTGQIFYNFVIDISGYQENVSIVLNNAKKNSITSPNDMKLIYKQKKLKRSKYNTQKNHKNIFGMIEATSLEGYTFQGWKRYFMEVFLYVQRRYYHDIQINLDSIQLNDKLTPELSHGIMTLGPKLKENKIYQQIKKNTNYVNYNIIGVYSGIGERNNRLQLGGYQQEYARGDAKTGTLLYEFPLKANDEYWQIAVEKVYFTRSKNRKTDQFLINPNLFLYRLSLSSQYLIFPQFMRKNLESFVQSEYNECHIDEFLECKNMSTIDITFSEFAFQLTPNYFINISLYDLRREYDTETKKISFYIKLSPNVQQIQIGSAILKQYYIVIDMDKSNLLYSPINRYDYNFNSIYVLRFLIYFVIFTMVMAVVVGIWVKLSDPDKRKKFRYEKEGIQLITYQRPGGIFSVNNEFDE